MAGHACALGWQCPQSLALRRPSDKSPLNLWLGHLLGAASGSRVQVCRGSKGTREAPIYLAQDPVVLPFSMAFPTCSGDFPNETKLIVGCFFGTWKGKGGRGFIQAFLPQSSV